MPFKGQDRPNASVVCTLLNLLSLILRRILFTISVSNKYLVLPGSGNDFSNCLAKSSKELKEFCAIVNGKEKTFKNIDIYSCHVQFSKGKIDAKSSYYGHCKSGKTRFSNSLIDNHDFQVRVEKFL